MVRGAIDRRLRRMCMKKTYIVIAFACIVMAACSDQRYASFGTGVEAQQSLEAKQGWIPAWFPVMASGIQVQYDIDSNYRWFSFKLDKENKQVLIKNFKNLSSDEVRTIKVPKPRQAEWWFKGLIQEQPSHNAPSNADFYLRYDGKIPEKAYLVISKTDDSIFLWIER